MSGTCLDNRLSWLMLEQYHLDALPGDERRQAEAHLASCPFCRGRLQSIEADTAPLPALPPVEPAPTPRSIPLIPWALGLGTAAAMVLIGLLLFWGEVPRPLPPQRIIIKGGELALTVVRERQGTTVTNPTGFREGDRFTLGITCAAGNDVNWEVVIFQGGQVYFPYADRPAVSCANRVPLPGAFRLTGDAPASICVVIDEAVSRAELRASGIDRLPESTVCITLEPLE